jgi:hypothetical protein
MLSATRKALRTGDIIINSASITTIQGKKISIMAINSDGFGPVVHAKPLCPLAFPPTFSRLPDDYLTA